MYAANNCVFQYHLPENMQYMRNWNRTYLDFAKLNGWRQKNDPIQIAIYSDTLQSFRLAAQGKTTGRQPPDALRDRIATHFDPLPFWYPPLEDAASSRRVPSERNHTTTNGDVSLVGFAERVAASNSQPQLSVRASETAADAESPMGDGAGSKVGGVAFDACCASAMRSSLERCGPGTRSARLRAHGNCHRSGRVAQGVLAESPDQR